MKNSRTLWFSVLADIGIILSGGYFVIRMALLDDWFTAALFLLATFIGARHLVIDFEKLKQLKIDAQKG